MKGSSLIGLLMLILSACNSQQKDVVNTLNKEICKTYETDFFNKYKGYQVNNLKQKGLDFIADYTAFCKIENCKPSDYEIVQAFQIFKAKDSVASSTFEYELVHFRNSHIMDSVIQAIKIKNCIDDATMKIHRIYRVGGNLIIGVSSYQFDITGYENFLWKEFNKSLIIEVINPSE